MFARIRSRWLAGGGALALTVLMSGVVAAATVLTVIVAPAPAAPVADTTATFQDLDGNGIDDRCQTAVVADPVAAASAEIAADLNGDGTISVTEAARSGRIGGKNCNHGGYVSVVAHGECAAPATADSSAAPESADSSAATDPESDASAEPVDATDTADSACAAALASTEPVAKDETPAVCVPPVVAPVDASSAAPVDASSAAPVVDLSPNAHGKAVSAVAQSDAVGGKNCNHGGAVSAAAKKDHNAAKAARDAAKAARKLLHTGKHHGSPAG